jgi:hypothetical protein
MKYCVNGTVTITLDIITEFEDDGKTDLRDQANEAVLDYVLTETAVPLSLKDDMEISDIVFEEVDE